MLITYLGLNVYLVNHHVILALIIVIVIVVLKQNICKINYAFNLVQLIIILMLHKHVLNVQMNVLLVIQLDV